MQWYLKLWTWIDLLTAKYADKKEKGSQDRLCSALYLRGQIQLEESAKGPAKQELGRWEGNCRGWGHRSQGREWSQQGRAGNFIKSCFQVKEVTTETTGCASVKVIADIDRHNLSKEVKQKPTE